MGINIRTMAVFMLLGPTMKCSILLYSSGFVFPEDIAKDEHIKDIGNCHFSKTGKPNRILIKDSDSQTVLTLKGGKGRLISMGVVLPVVPVFVVSGIEKYRILIDLFVEPKVAPHIISRDFGIEYGDGKPIMYTTKVIEVKSIPHCLKSFKKKNQSHYRYIFFTEDIEEEKGMVLRLGKRKFLLSRENYWEYSMNANG